MKQQKPIPLLAIDVGSSAVRAMCASRTTDGLINVVAYEYRSCSTDEICQGIVLKPLSIGAKIVDCVSCLVGKCKVPQLDHTFVCLGGKSMQIRSTSVKRTAPHRHTPIDQELLDEMDAEVVTKIETNPQNSTVVSVVGYYPIQYIINGDAQDEPPTFDQTYSRIEVNYVVFVGLQDLKKKTFSSLQQARLEVTSYFSRPDVLFTVLVSPEESQRGCAVIDMGCQTTTLTIYKGNTFTYTHTFPKGGDAITEMLSDDHLPFSVSEQVKTQFGSCTCERDGTLQIKLSTGTACITISTITDIVRDVIDEIFDELFSKASDSFQGVSKIYLTGGGALLKGVLEYVQTKIPIPIEYGSHARWLNGNSNQDPYCSPLYASLIGTLVMGFDYMDTHMAKKKSGLMTNLIDLFTQPD